MRIWDRMFLWTGYESPITLSTSTQLRSAESHGIRLRNDKWHGSVIEQKT